MLVTCLLVLAINVLSFNGSVRAPRTSGKRRRPLPHQSLLSTPSSLGSTVAPSSSPPSCSSHHAKSSLNIIIQWRGENDEGYSSSLRELEFECAFKAEVKDVLRFDLDHFESREDVETCLRGVHFRYQDALAYAGPVYHPDTVNGPDDSDAASGEPIPASQVAVFERAMQYVMVDLPPSLDAVLDASRLRSIFVDTVRRCSLIRTSFELVSEADSYKQLAANALENKSCDDLMQAGVNNNSTWSIRLRRYASLNPTNKQARYGKNVRSPLRDERKAIAEMADLVRLFRGKVDLAEPKCKIYLLEGLRKNKLCGDDGGGDEGSQRLIMARVLAQGPKVSMYSPKERICVTTTPLCPIAAFTMCNVAQIQRRATPSILDPFAGSCATLLAASHITNTQSLQRPSDWPPTSSGCKAVGVEICHSGYVNRDDIVSDFETRGLPPPAAIIRGDSLSYEVRQRARDTIGGGPFDVVVCDPPYGIREAFQDDGNEDAISPLTQLMYAMGKDRSNGNPLLVRGGRLVSFVPVRAGETLSECLPELQAQEFAGLTIDGEGKEQVLSDTLSRYLVCFCSK